MAREARWYHNYAHSASLSFQGQDAFFIGFLSWFFIAFRRKKEGTMLDLTFIRNNQEQVKEACRVKNNSLDVDHLLKVDQQVLALQRQVEETRAEQKQLSKRVQAAAKD